MLFIVVPLDEYKILGGTPKKSCIPSPSDTFFWISHKGIYILMGLPLYVDRIHFVFLGVGRQFFLKIFIYFCFRRLFLS